MQDVDRQTREQLRAQLAALDLTLDKPRLEALLPVYQGMLNGVRRIAALDLGETEPAMTFCRPLPMPPAGEDWS